MSTDEQMKGAAMGGEGARGDQREPPKQWQPDPLVALIEEVIPRLEEYRSKNVNKYFREEELDYREYTKMERYKNRVRIVDCFIEPLKNFLVNSGLSIPASSNERDIP